VDELIVTAIDKIEEPASRIELRERVNVRLPRVDLPEVLLEIAARTAFTSTFTHVSGTRVSHAGLADERVCEPDCRSVQHRA
jgi:hypothetical protein